MLCSLRVHKVKLLQVQWEEGVVAVLSVVVEEGCADDRFFRCIFTSLLVGLIFEVPRHDCLKVQPTVFFLFINPFHPSRDLSL